VSGARLLVVLAALALPSAVMAKGRALLKVSGALNLATASQAQLDQLPGIGEKAAKAIVDYRVRAPFTRVEELVKVKGFGKKRFDRLKPFLTLNGPTNLKVERLGALGRSGPPSK
jgi:competence protein ComEA